MFRKLLDLFSKSKLADTLIEKLNDVGGDLQDLAEMRERVARGVARGDFDDVIRLAREADRKQSRRARSQWGS